MGLFYRWRKQAPSDWVAGTAEILVSEPAGEPGMRENSGESIFELELNHFGYRTYDLTCPSARLPMTFRKTPLIDAALAA